MIGASVGGRQHGDWRIGLQQVEPLGQDGFDGLIPGVVVEEARSQAASSRCAPKDLAKPTMPWAARRLSSTRGAKSCFIRMGNKGRRLPLGSDTTADRA